jgi:hypothetical protein
MSSTFSFLSMYSPLISYRIKGWLIEG